jgi:bifunctional non-homologous end joining protein LigD
MSVIKEIKLGFTSGSSDKVYHVQIKDSGDGTYAVNAFYGRRGSTLKPAPQGDRLSLAAAEKAFATVVNGKTAKGYKVEATSHDPTTTMPITTRDRKDTGMRPQLLNAITMSQAQDYIEDDLYCLQVKLDGERLLVGKSGSTITPANRKGFATTIPPQLESALAAISEDFEIDGEIVDGTYHVFDMLWKRGVGIDSRPYSERYAALVDLLAGADPQIVLVDTFLTTEEKQRAFADAQAARLEGVVFKNINAPFSAGRPNSGGTQLKCKFWESASCIVGQTNAKRSVSLMLINDMGVAVSVGNVTVKPNQPMPNSGDVVEVKYLYMRNEGGALYQPELLAIRTDVDPVECTVDQIKLRG